MDGLDRGKRAETPPGDGFEATRNGDGDTPAAPPRVNPWRQAAPMRAARLPHRAAPRWIGKITRLRLPRWSIAGLWPRAAGALALGMVAATTVHPVGLHQQAVVSTLGQWGATQGPGLVFSLPWPIASVRVADVASVRALALPADPGEHLMLLRDGALADVAYDLRWHIGDLRAYALGQADPDAALAAVAETAVRAAMAGADAAALTGEARLALARDAARRAQAMLDAGHAGVVIDAVVLRRCDPPARVADALRAVAAARANAAQETDRARNWGRQWIAHAQGEAGAFEQILAQYRQAPAITRRQMYYATIERALAQSDKVIVATPRATITVPTAPLHDTPPEAGHGH